MFALKFNGRFELKDPDEFLQDLQELIRKHHVEYYGQIYTENLGEYVDFQAIEDVPEVEVQKDE